MTTLLTDTGRFEVPAAKATGEDLWLSAGEAETMTAGPVKPEGRCTAEVCVPLPPGREQEFVQGSRVNVAALWRHLGQPIVHSDSGQAWVLASSARDRSAALSSL